LKKTYPPLVSTMEVDRRRDRVHWQKGSVLSGGKAKWKRVGKTCQVSGEMGNTYVRREKDHGYARALRKSDTRSKGSGVAEDAKSNENARDSKKFIDENRCLASRH